MKSAFTLLEVLIALSILSISMLGIYSLLGNALTISTKSKARHSVVDKGYERVIKHIHYPRVSLREAEEYNGVEYRFKYEKENTAIPGVTKVRLTTSNDDSSTIYEYFEE